MSCRRDTDNTPGGGSIVEEANTHTPFVQTHTYDSLVLGSLVGITVSSIHVLYLVEPTIPLSVLK